MYDIDLYVLTSKYTGSGAEEFTYNMKNLERATIIGETTGGAAHPVDSRIVESCFVMHLPTGRPVNPISGKNWETTGVEPHIAVPADRALDNAYLMAIEKQLKSTEDDDWKFQLEWAIKGLRGKLDPVEVTEDILKKYAGEYDERVVRFKKGILYYRRRGPEYRMIPLEEKLFALEGLEIFRIEFVTDERGAVNGLIGLYENGMREPSKRTK
jgi:hypothetical protein